MEVGAAPNPLEERSDQISVGKSLKNGVGRKMSKQRLKATKKEIEKISAEISKLKDQKAELSLKDSPKIPQQIYEVETEIKRKESELISLEETSRGLMLQLKKLPGLRVKIREIKKRVKELDARGLKASELLDKHRQQVKRDVDNLSEINREFHRLQAIIDEIRHQVDPEELLNVCAKRSFEPPKNAVYFAQNKGIVSKW